MSTYFVVLTIFLTCAQPQSGDTAAEAPVRDLAALHDIARFELSAISEKDARAWVILSIRADDSSGTPMVIGAYFNATGEYIVPKNSRHAVVVKGEWERVGSLVPNTELKTTGEYSWDTPMFNRGTRDTDRYVALYDGGLVLTEHFPQKEGKDQFGKMVVIPPSLVKWIPPAYDFCRMNPDAYGEKAQTEQLEALLSHENPMLAIMAQQRLAKTRRFAGKALETALSSPADFRLPEAVYLAMTSRNKNDAYVLPEIATAIDTASAGILRSYVISAYLAAIDEHGLTANAKAVVKLCRDRALNLTLDQKARKELDYVFKALELPGLESDLLPPEK